MTEPGQASLESLDPSRRAVLVLLTSQNRRYEDLAGLLATDAGAIRARAIQAADELLAAVDPTPDREVRERLVDYALGQQRVSQRQQTRELLADSTVAREWVEALERALGIGGEERAANGAGRVVEAAREPPVEAGRAAKAEPGPEPEPAPEPAVEPERAPESEPAPARAPRPSRSRVYIAVGTIAVVAGIVLLLTNGSGGGRLRRTSTGANAASRALVQIVLSPAGPSARASGSAEIIRKGSRLLLGLRIADLGGRPGERYAVWLEGPPGARLLAFLSRGRGSAALLGAVALPIDAGTFTTLVVTRELGSSPAGPGPGVLQAPLPRPL